MKRKLFLVMAAFFAIGLLFIGCPDDPKPGKKPDPEKEEPFVPPSDWVGFTNAEMMAAQFYTDDGGAGSAIVDNGDGTYNVTIKTRSSGERHSVVWFTFADKDMAFRYGWYADLTLPKTSGVKPVQVHILPTENEDGANGTWPASMNSDNTGHNPATFDNGYVVGDLTLHWGTVEEVDFVFKTLAIWVTWDPMITAGEDYTFTINTLKVLPFDISTPDPVLAGWTPDSITPPTDWVDYPVDLAGATFYPTSGNPKIEAKDGGGYTVTLKVRAASDGAYSFINIPAGNFAFKGGYYLSLNLPPQTPGSTMKPKAVHVLPYNAGEGKWPQSAKQELAFKWVEGRTDFEYSNDGFGRHDAIEIQIYWYSDAVGEQDYIFTIDNILVKEETADSGKPPLFEGAPTGVKAYMQSSAAEQWGGAWGYQYVDATAATLSIDYDSGVFTSDIDGWRQFVLDLIFPASAVGKDYEFTLSEVKVFNQAGTDTLTETDILAGWRGGNDANSWAGQQGVVTKSEGVYKVRMTVIADDTGGITRFIIDRTASTDVYRYSFKAELPGDIGSVELTPWTQPDPPSAPNGWIDFSTPGPITRTIAANWDETAIQVYYDFTKDDVLFEGGYYLSVTLPSDSDAKPINIRTTAYDATNNVQDGWVSQKQITAPAGSYVSGTVVAFWDGNTYGGTPSATKHKKIEFVIIFAPGTATGGDYTFTVNAVKIPEPVTQGETEMVINNPVFSNQWGDPPTSVVGTDGWVTWSGNSALIAWEFPAGWEAYDTITLHYETRNVTPNGDNNSKINIKRPKKGSMWSMLDDTVNQGGLIVGNSYPYINDSPGTLSYNLADEEFDGCIGLQLNDSGNGYDIRITKVVFAKN